VVEGMQVRRGYLSPYFINNAEKQISVLRSPTFFCTQEDLEHRELLRFWSRWQVRQTASHRRRGSRSEALRRWCKQPARYSQDLRREGSGVRRPSQGHARRHRRPYRRSSDRRGSGLDPRESCPQGSRRAKRVEVAKEETTIIDGAGDPKAIEARSRTSAPDDEATSDYDKEKLQERVASSRVAWRSSRSCGDRSR